MESWRALTEAGTTCFWASSGGMMLSGAITRSTVMMRSSGLSSVPDSSSQSRRIFCAVAVGGAALSSSEMSEVSRAAVLARIVAMPSSLLSCSARAASVSSGSALARARSSRIRNAMTWNLVRFVGPSFLPSAAFASTSRTLRARTGMSPSLLAWRLRRCCCCGRDEARCDAPWPDMRCCDVR